MVYRFQSTLVLHEGAPEAGHSLSLRCDPDEMKHSYVVPFLAPVYRFCAGGCLSVQVGGIPT